MPVGPARHRLSDVAKRVVAEILAPGIAGAGDAGNAAQIVVRIRAGLKLAVVGCGRLLQAAVRVPRQALRQLLWRRAYVGLRTGRPAGVRIVLINVGVAGRESHGSRLAGSIVRQAAIPESRGSFGARAVLTFCCPTNRAKALKQSHERFNVLGAPFIVSVKP